MLAKSSRPLVIAHRGASAYAREHTFEAYDLALEMGADVLELDVRLTKDGVPAIVHDRTLRRTVGDRRAVGDVDLGDLLGLDPDSRPRLLEEVLERYGPAALYLIDLKEPRAPLESAVAALVARKGLGANVQVQSFSRSGLRRTWRVDPSLSVAQLYRPLVPAKLVRADLARIAPYASAIGPESASVDAALVGAAHHLGLRVQPYTVNDPAEIDRLVALGVDAVITDVPDRARAALDGGGALAAVA